MISHISRDIILSDKQIATNCKNRIGSNDTSIMFVSIWTDMFFRKLKYILGFLYHFIGTNILDRKECVKYLFYLSSACDSFFYKEYVVYVVYV